MASVTIINSANTLSVNSIPGQDVRFPITKSDSIFTFGSFRIERATTQDTISSTVKSGNFSNYSTLESLGSQKFDPTAILYTTTNELKPDKSNPLSYAYFGSFYTQVAIAINDIIENFPFAMASYDFGTGNTIFNYSKRDFYNDSSFSIPLSSITNQGNIIYVSGATQTGFTQDLNILTLYDNFDKFGIQISGYSTTHQITSYNYTTGSTGYLNFAVEGILFTGTTTATTLSVYIRPTTERYGQYKNTISNLENQLLFGGVFLVPDTDGETFTNQTFIWPKTIDGFNPDISGSPYETFKEDILYSARSVDETKTNIMLRTMIPDNYVELDSDSQIYTKLIDVYASEFDTIKQYIDGLAFAHTVSYDGKENIPDKFIQKLARLLGLNLTNAFSDVDFFEYLAGSDPINEQSYSEYNLDIWKRIMVNINWLYKKKGTRDALMFIFKILGAPDELIEFNEFVYKVNRVVNDNNNTTSQSSKINDFGYINYNASKYIFQEGGKGRGDGQIYLQQWSPEFTLEKTVDNIKIYTGTDEYFGTQNLLNTKEVEIRLSPAYGIENDVKDWYELGSGWWTWGSTCVPFSGLTVPYEWQINDIQTVAPRPTSGGTPICYVPSYITGMTISQWIDYIYSNNIDPATRKTSGYGGFGHMSIYLNLKKIYMTYMLWTNNQESNRLTIQKLEHFLELLERGFSTYIPQLIPATTIFDGAGTKYKNPVFNTHRFIYPPGINAGSEFQKKLPDDLRPEINSVTISGKITEEISRSINSIIVTASKSRDIEKTIKGYDVTENINLGINRSINSVKTAITVDEVNEKTYYQEPIANGTPIIYPI